MTIYKILFVTQDEDSSIALQNQARLSLSAIATSSTENAFRIIKNGRVESLVYEPNVSDFGRFELIEELKRHGIKIPILALTTDSNLAKAVGAYAYIGPDYFLRNPA